MNWLSFLYKRTIDSLIINELLYLTQAIRGTNYKLT